MEQYKTIFNQIKEKVKQDNYYIPRDYKTIGGMWTVDTYRKNGITLEILDEGWTIRIYTDEIYATDSGHQFKVDKGTLHDFINVLDKVK